MVDTEHRNQIKPVANRLLQQLNDAQRSTPASLERFGGELKFTRHPLFVPMVTVVRDPGCQEFATLEDDGSLNESAAIKLREWCGTHSPPAATGMRQTLPLQRHLPLCHT